MSVTLGIPELPPVTANLVDGVVPGDDTTVATDSLETAADRGICGSLRLLPDTDDHVSVLTGNTLALVYVALGVSSPESIPTVAFGTVTLRSLPSNFSNLNLSI